MPNLPRHALLDDAGLNRQHVFNLADLPADLLAPLDLRPGETQLLLFGHAFDTLGCISVVLETSWFNHRSRTAIARLGARQDGVMRNHRRHADGTVRDSVIFSILDTEWPAVRSNLLARLAHHEQDSK